MFPQPNPVLARLEAAAGGPIGAASVFMTQNSSARDQYYASQLGMHADALAGAFTGVYPQTLTAKPPTLNTLASPPRNIGLPSAPRGANNANTAAASARGSTLHSDRPGHLLDQLRALYPNTTFEFTKPGVAGQDVRVISGPHPSTYPGSSWPGGIDFADFKPGTPSGQRTFDRDQRVKWPQPTYMLPYDPTTGLLK